MLSAETLRDRSKQAGQTVNNAIFAAGYRPFYQQFFSRALRSGDRALALCPIPSHGHTGRGQTSLSIDFQRGLFHCFSRNEGGDAIRFYELMRGVTFTQAVREISKELCIDATLQESSRAQARPAVVETLEVELLPSERRAAICEQFLDACRSEDQAESMAYLLRRGIDQATQRRAGLAYFPRRAYRRIMRRMQDAFSLDELKLSGLFNAQGNLTFYRHRLLFPFYAEGRAIYLQARTTVAGVEPRWHNLRGGVPSLYNVDELKELADGSIVYLVEGFTDTLTLMMHGFPAVGIVGVGGFRAEWLAGLSRFRVVSALDGDEAGRRAAAGYQELFAGHGMKLAALHLPSDVNDYFRHEAQPARSFAAMTDEALEAKA